MTTITAREKWEPTSFIRRLEWLAPDEWAIPSDPDEETAGGERTRKNPTQESAARARLAALRRGLGKQPGEVPEVLPVLIPLLGDRPLLPHERNVAFLVGPLFASYPRPYREKALPEDRRNLGGSLWVLQHSPNRDDELDGSATIEQTPASEDDVGRSGLTPIERRFIALLDSPYDDLAEQLRGIVKLLAGKDIPIDWARLTRDLLGWEHPNRVVQLKWAESFWREERIERTQSETDTDESDTDD